MWAPLRELAGHRQYDELAALAAGSRWHHRRPGAKLLVAAFYSLFPVSRGGGLPRSLITRWCRCGSFSWRAGGVPVSPPGRGSRRFFRSTISASTQTSDSIARSGSSPRCSASFTQRRRAWAFVAARAIRLTAALWPNMSYCRCVVVAGNAFRATPPPAESTHAVRCLPARHARDADAVDHPQLSVYGHDSADQHAQRGTALVRHLTGRSLPREPGPQSALDFCVGCVRLHEPRAADRDLRRLRVRGAGDVAARLTTRSGARVSRR